MYHFIAYYHGRGYVFTAYDIHSAYAEACAYFGTSIGVTVQLMINEEAV